MEGGDVEGSWVVDATPTCMLLMEVNTQPSVGVVYCSICNQMLSFLAWRTFLAPTVYVSDSASPISLGPPKTPSGSMGEGEGTGTKNSQYPLLVDQRLVLSSLFNMSLQWKQTN